MPFFTSIAAGKPNICSKKIIVFGNGGHAKTIYGYFYDENIVKGFVVDDAFVEAQPVIGEMQVLPFSRILEIFPPTEYAVLVALGFKDLNQLRKDKTKELLALGYEFVSFIDRSVRVPHYYNVGTNTIVIGYTDIHEGVTINSGVFVSSGVVLGHDSVLEDYSWIGSGVVLTGCVRVGQSSVLGMNVSVKQNTSLSHHTLISPNAFVNMDTPPYSSILTPPGKAVPIDSRKLHKFSYK